MHQRHRVILCDAVFVVAAARHNVLLQVADVGVLEHEQMRVFVAAQPEQLDNVHMGNCAEHVHLATELDANVLLLDFVERLQQRKHRFLVDALLLPDLVGVVERRFRVAVGAVGSVQGGDHVLAQMLRQLARLDFGRRHGAEVAAPDLRHVEEYRARDGDLVERGLLRHLRVAAEHGVVALGRVLVAVGDHHLVADEPVPRLLAVRQARLVLVVRVRLVAREGVHVLLVEQLQPVLPGLAAHPAPDHQPHHQHDVGEHHRDGDQHCAHHEEPVLLDVVAEQLVDACGRRESSIRSNWMPEPGAGRTSDDELCFLPLQAGPAADRAAVDALVVQVDLAEVERAVLQHADAARVGAVRGAERDQVLVPLDGRLRVSRGRAVDQSRRQLVHLDRAGGLDDEARRDHRRHVHRRPDRALRAVRDARVAAPVALGHVLEQQRPVDVGDLLRQRGVRLLQTNEIGQKRWRKE